MGRHRNVAAARLGAAMGELSIVSRPWQARDDVREYERRFVGRRESATLRIAVSPSSTHSTGIILRIAL